MWYTASGEDIERRMYGTETVRLAMIGMTGAGKSATGNMIAALDETHLSLLESAKQKGRDFLKLWKRNWVHKRPFLSRADTESVTQEASRKDYIVFGQKIAIVDTPGFVDTKFSEEKIVKDILEALTMLSPGPHAIIMVVKADRLTAEVTTTIKRMQEIFGQDIVNFLIVVFSGMDNIIRDGGEIKGYVEKLKATPTATVLRDLLREADDRYVGFDNASDPFSDDNEEQVEKLIKIAKEIAKRNSGRCYSNKLLKATYEKLREAKIDMVKREHAEEIRKLLQEQNDELKRLLEESMRKTDGGCFAATSIVLTKDIDGQEYQKALKDLDVGDLVESYDPNAKATVFSPVYFITYQGDNNTVSTLRRLYYKDTDENVKYLAIHPKHLVYANVQSISEADDSTTDYRVPEDPVMSEAVKEGDILWVKDASDDQLKPTIVLMADEVSTNVRHPLTFNHFILVDGVLASVHMYNERLLRRVTTPLRLTYKMKPSFNKSAFTRKMVKLWDTVEDHL